MITDDLIVLVRYPAAAARRDRAVTEFVSSVTACRYRGYSLTGSSFHTAAAAAKGSIKLCNSSVVLEPAAEQGRVLGLHHAVCSSCYYLTRCNMKHAELRLLGSVTNTHMMQHPSRWGYCSWWYQRNKRGRNSVSDAVLFSNKPRNRMMTKEELISFKSSEMKGWRWFNFLYSTCFSVCSGTSNSNKKMDHEGTSSFNESSL